MRCLNRKEKDVWISLFDRKVHGFLGDKPKRDSKYWSGKLGPLMKMHIDTFVEGYEIVDEFYINDNGVSITLVFMTL